MNPNSQPFSFAKFHSSFVVGFLDIVHSTEITAPLTGDMIDDFYTIFLEETSRLLVGNGAEIIKNVGDGILFYFPETSASSHVHEGKVFARVVATAKTLLGGREEINMRLKDAHLPQIDFRISMSYGSVSAMLGKEGSIIDLFGSVINTCTKMNKMAEANTCIVGDALHEKLLESGAVNENATKHIGDYTLGDLAFPVFQVVV